MFSVSYTYKGHLRKLIHQPVKFTYRWTPWIVNGRGNANCYCQELVTCTNMILMYMSFIYAFDRSSDYSMQSTKYPSRYVGVFHMTLLGMKRLKPVLCVAVGQHFLDGFCECFIPCYNLDCWKTVYTN